MSMLNRTRTMTQSLRAGARNMSSATEQEAKEQMARWTQISKGMIGFMGVATVVNVIAHASHDEHHEEAPKYAYLKLRNKPFPWKYSNCDLMDSHCKELAAAAEKAL
ncbi:hypothetical protein Poli38472_009076 [Pythium oligandrum]|uniref:Uncharacterized protein n=1 Tax=Pythium oligandrum TaxID=41045 RepID=A0A8K1CKU2_PYTOL|nr:hypothetical protein Poli38472_009076 [Pythium oligandrum]|eukprot:TMW64909.1 hypothetical protein Poli38472_009076 [Pythium oligandrum]